MKTRHKKYLKLNLMSLFFMAISFISITLAWFAYSGLASVSTEMDVKSWYIEFEKDNKPVSNDIVISLAEIYPGMQTVHETVNIKNMGDSDAQLKYSIASARILDDAQDEFVANNNVPSEYIEDKLSHDYPFNVNISLNKNYALAKDGISVFDVSVSWPLDSESNSTDSLWGTKAYQFHKNEQEKLSLNSSYKIRPSIKIVISVTAEQYIENDSSSDPNYNLGDIVLYDVINNVKCSQLSTTCLKTYVIDTNNKIGDKSVTLLLDLYNTYSSGTYAEYSSLLSNITSSWNVNVRSLVINDLLNIISKDVMETFLVRPNMSNSIIGNLSYNNRIENILTKTITYNGYYTFINQKFNYLSTNKCYWINSEYNSNNAFALTKIDNTQSKIYGENKSTTCSVVPVISVSKSKL